MAEISKISAVAIANVAKVDAVTKANIADINGLTIPSAEGTPAAAFSVRLLGSAVGISSYTGACMRVRRASDSVEADVGFDTSDELSLTSPISNTSDAQSYTDLADFVDHTGTPTSALVRKWYDQASNKDQEQSTAASQPKVYDASTGLVTAGTNNKAALEFDGTDDGLNCSTNLRTSTGASTVIQVRNVPLSSSYQQPFGFYKIQRHLSYNDANYRNISISTNETAGKYIKFTDANLSDQLLHFSTWDGSTQTDSVDEVVLYQDGAQETGTGRSVGFGVMPSASNSIGFREDTSGQFCDGTFQEVIVYLTDQTSNRTDIEENINDHFQIF